jgi:hypothetical protein
MATLCEVNKMKTSEVQKEKVKTPLCVLLQAQLVSMCHKHALCLAGISGMLQKVR